MFKSKKMKWLTSLSIISMVGVTSAVSLLTGFTYQYNTKMHNLTNSEQVVEISNNINNSRNAALAPEASPDGSYYNLVNNNTLDDPKSNDSIDFGEIYNISKPRENLPYGSRIAVSMLSDVTNKNIPIFANFFGIQSTMYHIKDKDPHPQLTDPNFVFPVGFITYPAENDVNNVNKDTQYKFSFRSAATKNNPDNGSRLIGVYKPQLGGWPSNFSTTKDLYGKTTTDIAAFQNASFTNARTFDINGNMLSDINVKPGSNSWEYVNLYPHPEEVLAYGGVFLPTKWEVTDHLTNRVEEHTTSQAENYKKQIEFSFANYIKGEKTDAKNINSVSMTVSASYINTTLARNKLKAIPSLKYFYSNNASDFGNRFNDAIINNAVLGSNDHQATSFVSQTDGTSSVPNDSRGSIGYSGINYGAMNAINVTMSLTPLKYTKANGNDEVFYAPLAYSGTTKSTLKATVENEDKRFSPIEFANKTLYAKGSQNEFSQTTDQDADFKVVLTNGYPGSEYGSTSKLYLNNVAGTVRWVYEPKTVLKDGLIVKASNRDTKEITVGGFKRIPGVTKIANIVNVQSPYTLAQDVAKEPFRYYKLIYDLALTNLPNPNDFINGGQGFNSNSLDDLQKILDIKNPVFDNIGDKTDDGYISGGNLYIDVSLKLYYNQHTNLVTPDMNQATEYQRVRLEGFKHIEPTIIPDKPIYVGDPLITAKQATEASYQEGIKQSIVNGMQKKITPTAANDFRTTEGGTLPVTDDAPDFTNQISLIDFKPNNLNGTLNVTVTLNKYFAGKSEYGALKSSGFKPVEILITGYKKVEETKLNSTVEVSTDKTADDAVNQSFISGGAQQYPYIQFLLTKHKNDAFTGLPPGFNAGSIQIDNVIANNLEGTINAQISLFTYYDASGNLIDLTVPSPENAGLGPKPLGSILIKGFKKVRPTVLRTNVMSVANNLEFYNTLPSQVDDIKIASLIFSNKDTLFSSYPGLHFSVNSIQILDVFKDNLDGSITASFALTRYYNEKGKYIEADGENLKDQWLYFDGKQNRNLKILGFTQVKPTEFINTSFNQSFTPNTFASKYESTTVSNTNLNTFKEFLDGKNASNQLVLGGSDTNNDYKIFKKDDNKISLSGFERSAWEILQLSSKTIFQISPNDIATFILRIFQYAGMENYGISIKNTDISVIINTNRDPNKVENTSNTNLYENEDWYKGALEVEVSVKLIDNTWRKKIIFDGKKEEGKNVFNRYTPIPIYKNTSAENDNKNLVTSFSENDIEKFIFQNIDQIINGSFNVNIPSGKPVNFSSYNISISNILYNNNQGRVSVDLEIDNFYLPSGNLSTSPTAVDGNDPAKKMKTTIVFSGFKQQRATEFKQEINLSTVGAQIPFTIENTSNWSELTASSFWNKLSEDEVVKHYDKQQLIYDLIMGTGKLWADPIAPNANRILFADAEIPTNFSKNDIINFDNATFSNINGRIDIIFKIVNYFDSYGNLELNIPKTVKVSLLGFKTTQSSVLAGSTFDSKDFTNIYIKGSYDISASLVTPSFIIDNILTKTSGVWPPQNVDGNGENTNNFDFLEKIDSSSISIVTTNNAKGEVKASFRLLEDVSVYDNEGNVYVLSKNYTYNLIITGFASSLLVYVGISILIIFVLFILIPAIVIIIKRSRLKSLIKGKVSDIL